MINDYIFVSTASVIDLSINAQIVLDATQNSGVVISNVINIIAAFFDPRTRQLGQNANISELKSNIQRENGVVSLVNIEFINKVGGRYSSSQTSQQYENEETKQIKVIDETLFAEPNQIYQVRFPQSDITIQVKNLSNTNFS